MEAAKENIRKYAAGDQEDNYCRLCFVKAFKLRNVFPYGDDPNSELSRKISALALVKLSSAEEPDCCVCSRCVTSLEEFSKFQRQCVEYNRLLCVARGKPEPSPTKQPVAATSKVQKTHTETVNVGELDVCELKVEMLEPEDENPFEEDYTADDYHDNYEEEDEVEEKFERPTRTKKRPAKLATATPSSPAKKRGRKSKALDTSTECDEKKETPKTTPTATRGKPKKLAAKQEPESSDEFEEDATDSDASFKPARRKPRARRTTSPAPKKSAPKKSKTTPNDSLVTSSGEQDEITKKGGSSSNFRVNNSSHGVINIVYGNNRYSKFRYYKTRDGEMQHGWQCIEQGCTAQIYTRGQIKGRIFFKNRFQQHTHEPDNVDELLTAKIEDDSFDRSIGAELIGQMLLKDGFNSNRRKYTPVRLPSGEEILVYHDHQHRLLLEKTNGVTVYGCVVDSCRALIYKTGDDFKVYSGCSTLTEKSFDQSYRKTAKMLCFDGHYYVNSGSRVENRGVVWWCALRHSHNCLTLLYVTDGDLVVPNRLHVRVPHNHAKEDYKLEENATIVQARVDEVPIESTDYHVAKNKSGADFIIFEGYRYSIISTRVNGTLTCRCMESRSCGAYIYLVANGTIVRFTKDNEHSHEAPEREKPIEEFDYIIQTVHVERTGPLFKILDGFEFKRHCQRSNSTFYYQCVYRPIGCLASFTASADFSTIRENPEKHNHLQVQAELARLRSMMEDEGTTDYKLELNADGYDVIQYKSGRFCHFYNHKDGWRVWRCFKSQRCRATLFQDREDGRVCDVDRIQHKHHYKKHMYDQMDGDEEGEEDGEATGAVAKEESRNYSDSDSRDNADWF